MWFFFLFTFSMTIEGVPFSKSFVFLARFFLIFYTMNEDVIHIYHLVIHFMHL